MVPDSAIELAGFSVHRSDRTKELTGKSRGGDSKPCFKAFMAECLMFIDSLKCTDNKKSKLS